MEQTSGRLLPRTLSKVSANNTLTLFAEILILLLFGVLAAVLHARFRIPLKLPGHHGIEFMAIFMFLRQSSRFGMAGTATAIGTGAALLIPVLGFKDPFMAFVFVVPGLLLDMIFNLIPKLRTNILIAGLIAGISYASIPVCRDFISMILGIPYGSLLNGPLYPVALHFVFGFIGGSLGTGVFKLVSRDKQSG